MVAYAMAVCKSFYKLSGILIFFSEWLILLRHVQQIVNWIDQAGTGKMTQGGVDITTHLAFWSYIIGTLIEFFLLFAPILSSGAASGPREENAASDDIRLDVHSENELGKKIETYKTQKAGKTVEKGPNQTAGYTQGQHTVVQTVPTPTQFNNAQYANNTRA